MKVSDLYEVGLTSDYPTTAHLELLESVENMGYSLKHPKDPTHMEDTCSSGKGSSSSELNDVAIRDLKLASTGKRKWSCKAKPHTLATNWVIQEIKVGGKRRGERSRCSTNFENDNVSCKKVQVSQSTLLNSSSSMMIFD
ncbi:unnamed protein product [Ilex paraguariensis]|uniref:Uncharacterized protein n=1 Tax=Ilex paraguariensis TaxID=185542 RepID=A0ABC8U7V5_9AQUA